MATYKGTIKTKDGNILYPQTSYDKIDGLPNHYMDLSNNQTIDGQKDFEVIPRIKVTHETHNLPDAYQEVKYIESSGTQYIDSNYIPNANTKIIFDSMMGVNGISGDIRQGRHGDGQRLSIAIVSGNKLEFAIGGYLATSLNVVGQRHLYELDVPNLVGKMDGITQATFSSISWTNQQTLYFFARHMSNGQDGFGNVRNYNIKIYEQDVLIRHFIPCYRISDDEPGMYDIVREEFFVNSGTGEFTTGEPLYPTTYETVLTDASFAPVAYTGDYTNLTNKPTNLNQFTNGPGYVTSSYHDSTKANQSSVDGINAKIPSEASSSNQLADKAFVNSSIGTATATFKGTYTSVQEIEAIVGADDNDYAFYQHVDAAGNTLFDRYKYNGTTWLYEYTLNNSSFTADQWASINSGVSEGAWVDVATAQVIDGQKDFEVVPRVKVAGEHPREGLPDIYTQLQYVESNGSQYIDTGFSINTATDIVEIIFELLDTTKYLWLFGEHDNNARMGLGAGDGTNMRNVAYGSSTYKANDTLFFNTLHSYRADSTGVYIDETKIANYSSFSSTSTLALFCLHLNGLVSGTSGKIQSYKHTRNNTVLIDLVPVTRKSDDKVGFYDFATNTFIVSGSGVDLIAGPEIIGDHYGSLLTSGSFANVAFSGSYLDLANTPTIPTVNNATLTIQKNGTTVGTFTANASSNVVVNITAPQTYVLSGATSTNGILNVPIDITKYRILQITLANLDINAGAIGANDIYIYGADNYLYQYGSAGMLANISAASSPANSCNIDFGSGMIWSNNENISITILYIIKT